MRQRKSSITHSQQEHRQMRRTKQSHSIKEHEESHASDLVLTTKQGTYKRGLNHVLIPSTLSLAQRQSILLQMGQSQGNAHLQRMINGFAGIQHSIAEDVASKRSLIQRQDTDTTNKELSIAQIQAAIHWNNRRWKAPNCTKLLSFLRQAPVAEDESFIESDIQHIAQIQARSGAESIDGMVGDSTTALLIQNGLLLTDKETKFKARQVALVFYPGELEDLGAWQKTWEENGGSWTTPSGDQIKTPKGMGKLCVKVGGQIIALYNARGGPPIRFKDGEHTAGPTEAGHYSLARQEAHTTKNWYFSQIPYGAELRWAAEGQNIQYRIPGKERWLYATEVEGTEAISPLNEPFQVTELLDLENSTPGEKWAGGLPKVYRSNDFGPAAWNMTQAGKRTSYYVHTEPSDEIATELGETVELSTSHGCLHLRPADRDEMISQGFLQKGVRFIVKSYSAHLLPKGTRSELLSEL